MEHDTSASTSTKWLSTKLQNMKTYQSVKGCSPSAATRSSGPEWPKKKLNVSATPACFRKERNGLQMSAITTAEVCSLQVRKDDKHYYHFNDPELALFDN